MTSLHSSKTIIFFSEERKPKEISAASYSNSSTNLERLQLRFFQIKWCVQPRKNQILNINSVQPRKFPFCWYPMISFSLKHGNPREATNFTVSTTSHSRFCQYQIFLLFCFTIPVTSLSFLLFPSFCLQFLSRIF